MIPHIQTNTDPKKGNCWQTALASVLDVEPETVPHFVQWEVDGIVHDYWIETWFWLINRGLVMNNYHRHPYTNEYYLVIGYTVRDTYHVCVYQNGKLAHDPHPSGVGLLTEESYVTIRNL